MCDNRGSVRTSILLAGVLAAMAVAVPAVTAAKPTPLSPAAARIYVMRPDGSRLRQLARLAAPIVATGATWLSPLDLRWSPNGRYLAFAGAHESDGLVSPVTDLYVMAASGRSYANATSSGGDLDVVTWAWSPDSVNAACIIDSFPSGGVVITGEDGGRFLVFAPHFESTREPGVAFGWSPDGRTVAYSDGTQLLVVAPDGSGKRVVTAAPPPYTWLTDPAWSADGKRIAFVAARTKDSAGHVFVVNADGSGLVEVAGTVGAGAGPVWSSRGKIAFTASDGVYVVSADGSGLVEVSRGRANLVPKWAPDGLHLALVPASGSGHVFVVGADGAGLVDLTRNARRDFSPVWSPDGKRLALLRIPRRGPPRIVTVGPAGGYLRVALLLPPRTTGGKVDWSSRNELAFTFDTR
jgi:Tol biopolymer transport system component